MFVKEKYEQNTVLKQWIRINGVFEDVAVFQIFRSRWRLVGL